MVIEDTSPAIQRADEIQRLHDEIMGQLRTTVQKAIRIGELLTEQKADLQHGQWLPWLEENVPFSERTARNYMRVYEKRAELKSANVADLSSAYRAVGLLSDGSDKNESQIGSDSEDPERGESKEEEKSAGATVVEDSEQQQSSPLLDTESEQSVHFKSTTDKWNTPPEIIEASGHVLQGITLDPCSNDSENPNIPADHYFTEDDDGLSKQWFGTVYMNPPYGRVIADWVSKLCGEWKAGHLVSAICLVPSRTDTKWFDLLHAYPRCYIRGRLSFSGHENSAPFPSMVVYFGPDIERFKKGFQPIGRIYPGAFK